jgi:pimeloyl-ACP methyl ester carboxylesterase
MINRKIYQIDKSKLSVLESGNEQNSVVVFIHGIPASAELWRDTMIKLSSKGYYCLAPDLSGYGETEIEDDEFYNLTKCSELLILFFKEKGFTNIKLVAHDIGGGIAQILMTKEEKLFNKVILSNCVTEKSWPVSSVQLMIIASKLGLFYWFAKLGFLNSKTMYKEISKSFYRNVISKKDFKRIFYDGKFNKEKSVKKFQKMLKYLGNVHTLNNMAALSEVKLPVDLVWAMKDKFQPWDKAGMTLNKTLTNSEVFKIENCGHFLQIDAFEDYTQILEDRLS